MGGGPQDRERSCLARPEMSMAGWKIRPNAGNFCQDAREDNDSQILGRQCTGDDGYDTRNSSWYPGFTPIG